MRFPLLLVALLAAPASFAVPLETPAVPEVPLGPVQIGPPPFPTPPVKAPPLDLTLPAGPPLPGSFPAWASGPPDPLPIPSFSGKVPDLLGEVSLPPRAENPLKFARPFGGLPPQEASSSVPEPGTAALLALGLGALAAARRR